MSPQVYSLKNKLIFALLLLAMVLPSHVIANDRVVTIDEPWWVISGSNYYYALATRDLSNTIYDYHPAVTTTWMVAAGMFSYFPEYRGFGQGYFDVRKSHFEEFLHEQGKDPRILVRISRLYQTLVIAVMALLAFFLLQSLFGTLSAFLSVAFFMTAPYFLGHARLFNHEGMLAVFVLVSFLAMQVYVSHAPKWWLLALSGSAFGLAQLTKSSSIVVVGVVGLMLFVRLLTLKDLSWVAKIWGAVRAFSIWGAFAMLTFFALWPGMWVTPAKMLGGVYGNAFSYAFEGARLEVVETVAPSAKLNIAQTLQELLNYLRGWCSASTPLTWIGLLLALFIIVWRPKEQQTSSFRSTLVYLALLGGLFILLFSVARGRNSLHYILSSFVNFDVLAGLSLGFMLVNLCKRLRGLYQSLVPVAVAALLILFQIASGLPYAPYYFNYHTPLVSGWGATGYGEGYDLAANYLNQKSNAAELTAYVYNGMGTFSYLFTGNTVVLKRVYLLDGSFSQIAEEIQTADYLVLYSVVRASYPETEPLFDVLEQYTQPETVLYLGEREYFRIYYIPEIPAAFYDALSTLQK